MKCHCDSNVDYENCCQAIIEQGQPAPDAKALMRSRYSAFCNQNESYLKSSWHQDKRPSKVSFDDQQCWIGLTILDHLPASGECLAQASVVEFVAKYKLNGKAHKIHERSRFLFTSPHWYYHDGDHL